MTDPPEARTRLRELAARVVERYAEPDDANLAESGQGTPPRP
ncbi:hypothetical protein ACFWMQ_22170 [Streptomyces sp. NPDC058372]